jgi:hypothetical protein
MLILYDPATAPGELGCLADGEDVRLYAENMDMDELSRSSATTRI